MFEDIAIIYECENCYKEIFRTTDEFRACPYCRDCEKNIAKEKLMIAHKVLRAQQK